MPGGLRPVILDSAGAEAVVLTFARPVSTFYLTMNSPLTDVNQLLGAGRRLDARGFIAGNDGNLSIRRADGTILITASGLPKGRLTPNDIVVVDPEGNRLSGAGRASSESAMHLFVYRMRSECRACVHSHPPYATAAAVAGRELPEDVLPEVTVFVGPIALTEYAPPGTEAVPRSLAPFIANHDAFLLRNHGLLTIGRTMDEALNRHETVEQFARIYHLAIQAGAVGRIPDSDLARLRAMRRQLAESSPPR